MPTKCAQCPLRKLAIFTEMTGDEIAFMQRFKAGELTVTPGSQILMEGSNTPQLFTVLNGMGLRYKSMADGRRQVLNFVFPGDFLGMQAGVMGEMQHSVEATTNMTLCVFNRSDLWGLFKSHPERAFDLTWLAAREEAFLGDAVSSIGQRTAIERVAWAAAYLHSRLSALKMSSDHIIPFPYRQQDLADALGLSLVHTNKTLAKLRDRQLLTWRDGEMHVHDPDELARIAQVEIEREGVRPLL